MCWVTRDNEAVPLAQAPDSRAFGPVLLSAVTGRVVYASRGRADHGAVSNSEDAAEADAPVLAHELDVDALANAS
jgi:hypothetical protein